MYKKLSLLTPIIITVSMSGCSGTKPLKTATISHKATPVVTDKVKIIPVVYEKRSPKIRKRSPARRYIQKRRTNYGSFANKLSNAALGRLRSNVTYNGAYVKIGYPWGDVPANIGVCTDVVIRSYRKLGIDLQQQVHQDMTASFSAYPNPKKWGLSRPDTNIDHRRVYNLRAFFARRGAGLPITRNPSDYRPGDVVTWMVGPGLPHIGVVVNRASRADPRRKMIVHNIARGPQMEDVLFRFPITGHYRYTRAHMGNIPKTIFASRGNKSRSRGFDRKQLADAASLLASLPAPQKSSLVAKTNTISNTDLANFASKTAPKSIQVATLNTDAVAALLRR